LGGAVKGAAAVVLAAPAARAGAAGGPAAVRTLDGSGNNLLRPGWGKAGTAYRRLAPARYGDGVGAMLDGPGPRYISNRIFNPLGVDMFSERNVSQFGWVWGQVLDHTFGMAEAGTEAASIPFDRHDALESYRNDLGLISFARDAVAAGTGTGRGNPRQQVNTVNSYIDAWPVYGGTSERLDWLRGSSGPGTAPGARLMLPGGYLPRAGARGDAGSAPVMQTNGQLSGRPQAAAVAGDVRANENAALTAVQTLLAREHNRIVARLPRHLSDEQRFQIARRVVGAEQQYITYNEFLPSLGIRLSAYRGYRPDVNPELYSEFATVGYRAHSMVNGEEHIVVDATRYTRDQLAAIQAMGIAVTPVPASSPAQLKLTISQSVAFFNPAVLPAVGLGPILRGLAEEPNYKNDEQIDDTLRSVLFEFPAPGPREADCLSNPETAGCFQGVVDLGAIDIQRGRDNGMPTYNELRHALGLPARSSFTQITGESTDRFPSHFGSDPIDNPGILEFTSLRNLAGRPIVPGDTVTRAVSGTRASTLAARLRAIYGTVETVDAFVGMVCEPHVRGTEFGQLQLALWCRQFEALRDGDRFFYLSDPVLDDIHRRYGITYRHTLAELIALNTDVPLSSLAANVFFAPPPGRATR
jgi:hypothetical protein